MQARRPGSRPYRALTTTATNALVERRVARTALVTTDGLADILHIGRQDRPSLDDLSPTRPDPLVAREDVVTAAQPTGAGGERVRDLGDAELARAVAAVVRRAPEAVAVSLQFSYAGGTDERRLCDALAVLAVPVTRSSDLLPEAREVERTSTCVIKAALEPVMRRYLSDLAAQGAGRRALDAGGPAALTAVGLEVYRDALAGVAEEMGAALRRAAFSPNIKERTDCPAAVFGPDGDLVAQAEHIPAHLGAMPASVRAVVDTFGPLRPVAQVCANDPYAGGSHLPDLTLVAAVAAPGSGDELLAYVAKRANHADVGGAAPGSMPADASDIAMEGLRIQPLRVADATGPREDIVELIAANSRTPSERRADTPGGGGRRAPPPAVPQERDP
ncbi:MAG: hydantoinase B/oxoprolinase family protein [Actinomycetota bacterium]|nr:hydantoinase B/oxoprolinase family protein [Actinomycetota bacterium]